MFEAGTFYVMDRGYMDFSRLDLLVRAGAFFVTRAKDNPRFSRQYSQPVDQSTGLRSDQIGKPTLAKARQDCCWKDALERAGQRRAPEGLKLRQDARDTGCGLGIFMTEKAGSLLVFDDLGKACRPRVENFSEEPFFPGFRCPDEEPVLFAD